MLSYYQQYGTLLALLFAGVGVVVAAYWVTAVVSPARPQGRYGEKALIFESGIDPLGDGWTNIQIRYYLYALLFVVFDVETMFVYPWATYLGQAGEDGPFALAVMLVFLAFVAVTIPYELKKGVFQWV